MRPILTVPGIQNSGPGHWQSRWEALHPGVTRVQQRDWDHPVCDEWAAAIDAAVRAQPQPPILVAHSLGCLAVAHWAARSKHPIHAALLVAVPDPAGPSFPTEAIGFAPLPATLTGRRLRMVASHDDPYGGIEHARARAAAWGAELVELGGADGRHRGEGRDPARVESGSRPAPGRPVSYGHLNAASGLGDWPQAWAWVEAWRTAG